MARKGIIIGIIVAVIMIVATYIYLQYQKLYNATWTYAGQKLKKFAFDKVTAEIYMDVDNKGDLLVTVSQQDYIITLNGTQISTVKNTDDVIIASNSVTRIPLLVEIGTSEFLKALGSNWQMILLGDKSKVIINIKGYFTLKLGIFAFHKLPFDTSMTLADLIKP